ncbi:hypothetical protein QYF61_020860 [Mycteria americana]|uniref:Uncharacterized protein n=1 Tax=Mycteria americana TaxID=33587 RepID=A0AAN7MR45_MYCAM|nr:hypothetical protein QYF61_020860 [Mycteria americana]
MGSVGTSPVDSSLGFGGAPVPREDAPSSPLAHEQHWLVARRGSAWQGARLQPGKRNSSLPRRRTPTKPNMAHSPFDPQKKSPGGSTSMYSPLDKKDASFSVQINELAECLMKGVQRDGERHDLNAACSKCTELVDDPIGVMAKRCELEHPQGWRLNCFPGQPVPMLDHPFSEVKFPNIQSKPPLAQLEAISSRPTTCYLGEETDPHLSTTFFQVVVESNKVSPQPPFLQATQPQFPQPLLIRLVLQTLPQLRCPSLHTLQPLNVSLVVRDPKLNTAFEVRPHQCRVQGHDHFPSPAGHAIFDTSQDAIGFLGRLGTLLAHIQLAVNQHPQVLFRQAAFQPLFPKPVALHGVAVTQVQDLALGLVEPHTIGPSPSIQPGQIPLQSLPTLKLINTPTQLGVVCKLSEGALDPFVQIIDKDIEQDWPQHRALGNTACDWPPTGVNSIYHHSLGPAIQPVLYPAKSTPIQAMRSQFLQENAVGNHVKGFTEV